MNRKDFFKVIGLGALTGLISKKEVISNISKLDSIDHCVDKEPIIVKEIIWRTENEISPIRSYYKQLDDMFKRLNKT